MHIFVCWLSASRLRKGRINTKYCCSQCRLVGYAWRVANCSRLMFLFLYGLSAEIPWPRRIQRDRVDLSADNSCCGRKGCRCLRRRYCDAAAAARAPSGTGRKASRRRHSKVVGEYRPEPAPLFEGTRCTLPYNAVLEQGTVRPMLSPLRPPERLSPVLV